MSSGRYDDRKVGLNNSSLYRKFLEDSRGVSRVQQYVTGEFGYPSIAAIKNLVTIPHIWKLGDRYYKLAHKHYGNSEMWWVIALFNKRPTEAHVSAGDVIHIPKPIEVVVEHFMTYR